MGKRGRDADINDLAAAFAELSTNATAEPKAKKLKRYAASSFRNRFGLPDPIPPGQLTFTAQEVLALLDERDTRLYNLLLELLTLDNAPEIFTATLPVIAQN